MDAQTVANWLTFGLGIATVWMAVETRRMSTAAMSSIELETRPYLAFRGLYLSFAKLANLASSTESPALRVGLRLFNPGKVLVNYQVEFLFVSFAGSSPASPTFETTGGVIHPGEETIFFYPWLPFTGQPNALGAGEVAFTIAFRSTEHQHSRVKGKLTFTVKSQDGSDFEWVFKEGPIYG
ncbi:MAG: hypothetical protein HY936_05125 [Nitrosomonadales bacterium]|nr:hypothetical protein [Nitrosomonadales bacterium]